MKPIAEYKRKAIALLLVPDLGREATLDEVQRALATLRHTKAVPVRVAAAEVGLHHITLKNKLLAAGIKPTRLGGPSGRKNCYDMQDVLKVIGKDNEVPE